MHFLILSCHDVKHHLYNVLQFTQDYKIKRESERREKEREREKEGEHKNIYFANVLHIYVSRFVNDSCVCLYSILEL